MAYLLDGGCLVGRRLAVAAGGSMVKGAIAEWLAADHVQKRGTALVQPAKDMLSMGVVLTQAGLAPWYWVRHPIKCSA